MDDLNVPMLGNLQGVHMGSGSKGGGKKKHRSPPFVRGQPAVTKAIASPAARQGNWHIQPIRRGRDIGIRLTGSDLLYPVSTSGSVDTGDQVFEATINPNLFINTRLAQFAPLFQKFMFRKISFEYEPSCAVTTPGQLIHYVDYDADQSFDDMEGLQIVQFVAAHKDEQPFNAWQRSVTSLVPDDPTAAFYMQDTGPDRLFAQGKYHLFVANNVPDNTPLGMLYMKYDVEMFQDNLGPSTQKQVGSWSMGVGVTDTTLLGNQTSIIAPGGFVNAGIYTGGQRIVFAAEGYFWVWVSRVGTVGATYTPNLAFADFTDVILEEVTPQASAGSHCDLMYLFHVTDANAAYVQWDYSGTANQLVEGHILIYYSKTDPRTNTTVDQIRDKALTMQLDRKIALIKKHIAKGKINIDATINDTIIDAGSDSEDEGETREVKSLSNGVSNLQISRTGRRKQQ